MIKTRDLPLLHQGHLFPLKHPIPAEKIVLDANRVSFKSDLSFLLNKPILFLLTLIFKLIFNLLGTCIWSSWICDRLLDCPGGEDEENCKSECATIVFHLQFTEFIL